MRGMRRGFFEKSKNKENIMENLITINNHTAVIVFDPETEMFRGEFLNLNGFADFYATNIQELLREGEVSINIFLTVCKKQGIEPYEL